MTKDEQAVLDKVAEAEGQRSRGVGCHRERIEFVLIDYIYIP